MPPSPGEVLREGIARNVGAILSIPSAGMQRNHHTRLLAEQENGFVIEAPPEDTGLLDQLIDDSTPVALEVKAAQENLSLSAPLCERLPGFEINPGVMVPALVIRFPENIRPVQRRAHYRVALPEEFHLSLRIWRIPEHAILRDRPMSVLELHVQARNMGIGGIGFSLTPNKNGEFPPLKDDQRLRVQMMHAGKEIIVEGRLRYLRPVADKLKHGGFSFKKLERDLAGRQTLSHLTALVGHLQRDEIRRRRGLN